MPQSLAQVHIHVIFSTKNRMPFLVAAEFRREMHAYLVSVMKAYESPAQIVGGTADHVHILCALSRSATIAKVIGEVKRNSSKWIKTKGGDLELFQWQNGYGAFSVSFSKITEVRECVPLVYGDRAGDQKANRFRVEKQVFLLYSCLLPSPERQNVRYHTNQNHPAPLPGQHLSTVRIMLYKVVQLGCLPDRKLSKHQPAKHFPAAGLLVAGGGLLVDNSIGHFLYPKRRLVNSHNLHKRRDLVLVLEKFVFEEEPPLADIDDLAKIRIDVASG
jgi:putative transposase